MIKTVRWSSMTASFSAWSPVRRSTRAAMRLAAVLVSNLQRLPVLDRELHRFGEVCGGNDHRRGQEPIRSGSA